MPILVTSVNYKEHQKEKTDGCVTSFKLSWPNIVEILYVCFTYIMDMIMNVMLALFGTSLVDIFFYLGNNVSVVNLSDIV